MIFRRGVSIGFLFVVILAAWCCAFGRDRARFRVGQVVAVDVVPGDHEYFRVGFIDSALETDGRIHYKYTDAQRRIGGEWPEESLRALSLTECGR